MLVLMTVEKCVEANLNPHDSQSSRASAIASPLPASTTTKALGAIGQP